MQHTKAMDGLAAESANARTVFFGRLITVSNNALDLKRNGSVEFVFPFHQTGISAHRKMNSAAAIG